MKPPAVKIFNIFEEHKCPYGDTSFLVLNLFQANKNTSTSEKQLLLQNKLANK
ncbi:MAG: hypothetical protein ACI9M1_002391 [Porticoccaceae bacterium]|jgi:hypothetical protein